MRAIDLFQRIADEWPASVDISKPESSPGGGIWFPSLAKIWHEVEDSIDHTEDHWGNIACWAFYQAISSHASALHAQGFQLLEVNSVPLEIFHDRVTKNLNSDGWENERGAYRGL